VSLTASVILKNELGRYLEPFIGHLRAFCDMIVVLDDGSTDGTYEWLEQFQDLEDVPIALYRIDPQDGFFAGHEGRRRNELLKHTLNHLPNYVLAIDADEFIADGQTLREFCDGPRLVGSLEMVEVWKACGDTIGARIDGAWRPHPCPILWNATLSGRRGQRLRIPDKALACGREPEQVRRQGARPTGVDILHFGWANEAGRPARYDRYVTADGGKFHRNTHLDSIMWGDDKVLIRDYPWPPALEPWREAIVSRSC
jgi:glycosyltransferase involved in cell wall biosynthesis